MSLEYFIEPPLPFNGTYITFYPMGASPSGRYIVSQGQWGPWTLDRTTESCTTSFNLANASYNGLAVDDDGTVYALHTSEGWLYSWASLATGALTLLNSDAPVPAVESSLTLFVMPDDSRKLVWADGFTSNDIRIYDVNTDTLSTVINQSDVYCQQFLQDTYGDVWFVSSDADNIYFQRVIDNGAGSGSDDYVVISDPGRSDNNQIEAYHTSAGWFVVRGGGTDLFLFADADFAQLQHRSYAAIGSGLNASELAGAPFLMCVAPGQDSFWFPGPHSYEDESYSDLHRITAADLTTAEIRDISDWAIGDDPIESAGMVLSTGTRLALISNSSGADDDANVTVIRYFPEDVSGGGGDGVTDDDVTLRVWTYSLDNHDYYVLRVGQSTTLVYDLTTGSWSEWQSPGRTNWRAHVGANWVGMSTTTLNRGFGSDVVAGDDSSGVLWVLDPTTGRDDRSTTGDDAYSRVVTGGIRIAGRDVVPCGAVTVDLSVGAPTQLGASIELETSDDLGHTWDNHGSVIVSAGAYSQTVEWRALGTAKAPGRIFRLTDNGAAVRIDGCDLR